MGITRIRLKGVFNFKNRKYFSQLAKEAKKIIQNLIEIGGY